MTVKPLTPSFSQQFQSLELAGFLSSGEVVEARVVAMLEGGKVRLAIHGQTVDVSAPRAFRAGTLLAAVIDRRSGKLEVITQQNAPEPAPEGSGDGSSPSKIGAAVSRVIVALLGADLNIENLQPEPGLKPPARSAAACFR